MDKCKRQCQHIHRGALELRQQEAALGAAAAQNETFRSDGGAGARHTLFLMRLQCFSGELDRLKKKMDCVVCESRPPKATAGGQ